MHDQEPLNKDQVIMSLGLFPSNYRNHSIVEAKYQ